MVAITFFECFCLLFLTVEEPQYFIFNSLSHAWTPPSPTFFFFFFCYVSLARADPGGGGGVDWVASHPPWVCTVFHNIFV